MFILLRHWMFALALCTSLFLRAVLAQEAAPRLAIIPLPASIETCNGTFHVGKTAEVLVEGNDAQMGRIANVLASVLSSAADRTVPVRNAKGVARAGRIVMSLAPDSTLGPEGYDLSIEPESVHLRAATAAGLFYGVQTVVQMLPPGARTKRTAAAGGRISLPCVSIQDGPRFSWRGLMLDCSRTFLTPAYVKRTIDRMALYKLNVLHLHLTDDQGWRLEIKEYPKLTTVGARFADRYGGGGGYYSQQEMRELITYAKQRNITIVPEIEMPGHSMEVLAAYPELACLLPEQQTFEVLPFWEGRQEFSPPLCAGNDRVFEMYGEILSEVMELFPSEFIHVGGDEVPKDAWNKCPRCQARMKAEGLKDAEELQGYFMRRIEKMIEAKGRRMIGWDEILEGGLAPGATVMSWRGTKGGVAAANLGHDVVMTPNTYCYLDYSYQTTPTEKVYAYDPVPKEFSGAMAKHILGVQGSMWTHIAVSEKAIDYQM
jgi:hexosaminidase